MVSERALAKGGEDRSRRPAAHAKSGGTLLYLDDLAVGDTFESRSHAIDAEQIVAFASEFDPQAFHVDQDAANDTFFGGLAASGWHTAAVTMLLVTETVPFANGIIGAGGEIAWPSATRPGDVLRVRSEILEIKPSQSRPERGSVVLRSLTLNQHGDVRQELKARLIVFRRPGPTRQRS